MSRLDLAIHAVLQALMLAFVVFVVVLTPVREELSCEARVNAAGVSCVRTLSTIARTSRYAYVIPDPTTVMLDERADPTIVSMHVDFYVSAVASDRTKVMLLRVPENDTSYATTLASRIRRLPESPGSAVSFERREKGTASLLLGAALAFAAVVYLSFVRSRRAAAVSGSARRS